MSDKPKVEIKRVPSVKVAPKPVVKAPVKKARPVKPHHKYWTGRKNWKLNPEWIKEQEKAKKEEKKEEEKKEDKK
jgi:hypothetical protein